MAETANAFTILRCIAVAGIALRSEPLLACTLCDSPPAELIRRRLLGPDMLANMVAVMLPIILLLGVVALMVVRHLPSEYDQ